MPPGPAWCGWNKQPTWPGGTCWKNEGIDEVTGVARRAGLATHLDGARLLNAAVALGTPAAGGGRAFGR